MQRQVGLAGTAAACARDGSSGWRASAAPGASACAMVALGRVIMARWAVGEGIGPDQTVGKCATRCRTLKRREVVVRGRRLWRGCRRLRPLAGMQAHGYSFKRDTDNRS